MLLGITHTTACALPAPAAMPRGHRAGSPAKRQTGMQSGAARKLVSAAPSPVLPRFPTAGNAPGSPGALPAVARCNTFSHHHPASHPPRVTLVTLPPALLPVGLTACSCLNHGTAHILSRSLLLQTIPHLPLLFLPSFWHRQNRL